MLSGGDKAKVGKGCGWDEIEGHIVEIVDVLPESMFQVKSAKGLQYLLTQKYLKPISGEKPGA